ncbi:MAG: helix-turn-helix domain-containing protein [Micropruina sp.]
MWQDVLGSAGVTVETVDADHVLLRSPDDEQVFRLLRVDRPVSSSHLPGPATDPSLLAVPRATPKTVAEARKAGWNVVTDSGVISVQLGSSSVERSGVEQVLPTRRTRRGPVPWAAFTLARRLLAVAPVTQAELSGLVGVGQPRVSRVLAELRELGLVDRAAGGWRPADFDRLVAWWLATYRGAAGVTSYWYSLDEVATQTRRAVQLLEGVPNADPVVSGDAAADVLAPWRRPEYVTIYVKAGYPLASAGFVPVGSTAEATLTLCAAKDRGIWLPQSWRVDGVPLADPLQVAYDMATSAAVDKDEAVAHLCQALQARHAQAWRAAAGGRR